MRLLRTSGRVVAVVVAVCALGAQLSGQVAAPGRVQEVKVHGSSLAGNRLGIAADRTVSVYLPPSYDTSTRRYPVVFVLHGIFDTNRTWTVAWDAAQPGFATIQDVMNHGIRSGTLKEMIVVVPDADKTCHYTDSPIKGGWGSYVARDLVSYVDKTYRTIASPDARGLMGHSMGGHGAIKIAMTHPGVFGAVYALNPSLLGFGGDVSPQNPQVAAAVTARSLAEVEQANPYARAVVGVGQCFSPDPAAPLLTELPFVADQNGVLRAGPAEARWRSQMPLYMVATHADRLKGLRGFKFDSAFEDEFAHIPETARAFSKTLEAAGVAHEFEMYNGDHRNRLWGAGGRIAASALPFFSRLLGEPPAKPAPAATQAQVQLWRASETGDIRAASSAVKNGADVNGLDTRTSATGRRPLNYAAENNLADMIRWLAERGAEINRPNLSGFTPLHHAAESGSVASAEALLALGANREARLPSGSTPLDVARQRGHAAVVKLLQGK